MLGPPAPWRGKPGLPLYMGLVAALTWGLALGPKFHPMPCVPLLPPSLLPSPALFWQKDGAGLSLQEGLLMVAFQALLGHPVERGIAQFTPLRQH
jgi:hypothetical protein